MTPEKDPTSFAWLTYAWVLLLSTLGGVVNFTSKIKKGIARPFNLSEFIGEVITSAFAGILTFYLCEWAGINSLLEAAFVGISGHMGSRAIFLMERWAEQRFVGFSKREKDEQV
jgi:hypothetical protein